jgi:hypothetical protein
MLLIWNQLSTQGTIQNSKSNNNYGTVHVRDLQFTVGKTELEDQVPCPWGIPVVDRCSENWKDTEVKTQCEAYTAHTCSGGSMYRNKYCMLCNYGFPPGFCVAGVKHGFPFTILLDWKRLTRETCTSSEIYVPLSRVCRKVFMWDTWPSHGSDIIDVEYDFFDVAPCSLVEIGRRSTGAYYLHHGPDGRGSKYLWNVGQFLPDYTAQHPRRQSPS